MKIMVDWFEDLLVQAESLDIFQGLDFVWHKVKLSKMPEMAGRQ